MKNLSSILDVAKHATELFTKLRWPEGPVCPVCGSHNYYECADGRYKCKDCGKMFSIKTDSLFHGSHLSLEIWLIALYYMMESRGISSYQLAKYLGISQKSAYYMQMRLRCVMDQDDVILTNEIAHDEWYCGGTWRNFSLSKRKMLLNRFKLPQKPLNQVEKISIANKVNQLWKQPVFGMNDGENIVLQVMPNPVNAEDAVRIFNAHSLASGMAVSDCSYLYKDWEKLTGYELHCNNHSAGVFKADNGSSSNRIEGIFSLIHREFQHSHVHARRCYLQLYMNELAFRFNHRKLTSAEKLDILINRCSQKANRATLRQFNAWEDKLYQEQDLFDPWEFFKVNTFIDKIVVGGITYRRTEFGS